MTATGGHLRSVLVPKCKAQVYGMMTAALTGGFA